MELNYKAVMVLTKHLSLLRKNQLLKRYKEQPDNEISGAMALVLWTSDLLAAAGILSQPQQDLIFSSEIGDDIYAFGKLLELPYDHNIAEMPIGHLGIFNRSYAAATVAHPRQLGYLNLRTGDMEDLEAALKEPPTEVIHYNLTSLFQTRIAALNRLRKMKKAEVPDATHAHNDQ